MVSTWLQMCASGKTHRSQFAPERDEVFGINLVAVVDDELAVSQWMQTTIARRGCDHRMVQNTLVRTHDLVALPARV